MAALAKHEAEMTMQRPTFAPEAYGYTDDVTPEAVAQLRKAAKKEIENDEWELIDGFGEISAS